MYTHYTKRTLWVCSFVFALFVFCACERETAVADLGPAALPASFILDDTEDGHTGLPDFDFGDAIVADVVSHTISLDRITRTVDTYPDGTSEDRLLIDGCISVSKTELEELTSLVASGEKQYRTNNLVSPQTVTVIGYTGGGGFGLTNNMRTSLQWAVNNYNALNLNLTFSLSYSSSTNADMVVYRQPNQSGAGGQAGFPSGGNPFKWIQIYRGMDNYDLNTIEHVMTHEMGHAVGLRHTDFFSRQSCGQNVNEGSGSDGANHIPGTPTGYDANSVMLSCFGSGEDGEFGFYDRVALQYLY
ncbi:MAG: M57 family metalloprotease [Saprospiraceae bacterium]